MPMTPPAASNADAAPTATEEVVVVLMTAPNAEIAATIARQLVEERLAACVNILPSLRSIFSWEGKLCDESEALCLIKTRRELFPALASRARSLHPYQVPEIVAVPLVAGLAPYLDWVKGATQAP